jgi:hypothetical protein
MPSPMMMNSRLPNQIWEPGVKLMLPPATDEMTVGRRWGSVAILDPAGLVSCDAQTAPTWRANCRCNKSPEASGGPYLVGM